MTKEEKDIILDHLKDGSLLAKACESYWDATNSTAALVSLSRLREIIENMYNKTLKPSGADNVGFGIEAYKKGQEY